MIIVGITGGIGHGKTTFASYLADNSDKHVHLESSDLIIEIANSLRAANPVHPEPGNYAAISHWLEALPAILAVKVHASSQTRQFQVTAAAVRATPENYAKLLEYLELMQLHPERQRVFIDATNKPEFRSLLQWLGGYLVKTIDAGIWFDEIVQRILVREDIHIATIGGLRFPAEAAIVQRAGGLIIRITRPDRDEPDKQDITERERDLIQADIIIVNNGSLDELHLLARQLYSDLQAGKALPGTTYRSQTS